MVEVKAFIKLLDMLKQHDDEQFFSKSTKVIDASYLHNNNCLMEFYRQFEFKHFTIQTGLSSISFFDYVDLKEKNKNYFFSNLKEQDYIVFLEQTGGGDPVLFNFLDNNRNPSIYAAYDASEPFKIASNFLQFIEALTIIVDIVYNEYDIYEIYTNDDCDEIKSEFLPKMNMKLSPILGENLDGFMKYFFG